MYVIPTYFKICSQNEVSSFFMLIINVEISSFMFINSRRNENLNFLVRIKLIYFYIFLNKKNVLVQAKFYLSWDGGPLLVVRTASKM